MKPTPEALIAINPEIKVANIKRIRCLAELSGYEDAAKSRGILPEEMRAIEAKRKAMK